MTRAFDDLTLYSPSLHTLSGQTGSGKTGTACAIGEKLHRKEKKDIYIIIKDTDKPVEEYKLPPYIHSLRDAFNPPQDSVIIGDDFQRLAPARRAMSDINVVLDELMGLLRHDNIDFILDVQTYASLDRNSVIRCDYRWYKTPYASEVAFARPEIKDEVEEAASSLKGKDKTWAYLSSENREKYIGLVSGIKLPSWWSEELSVMHRRLSEEEMDQRKPIWERFRLF